MYHTEIVLIGESLSDTGKDIFLPPFPFFAPRPLFLFLLRHSILFSPPGIRWEEEKEKREIIIISQIPLNVRLRKEKMGEKWEPEL